MTSETSDHVPAELLKDFEAIRSECFHLVRSVYTARKLFGDVGNQELMRGIALRFFLDVNELMHESFILRVCRLFDPAVSNVWVDGERQVRQNLTIPNLNSELEKHCLFSADIEKLSDGLFEYCKKFRGARNQAIAHRDKESIHAGATLGGASPEELDEFLQQLQGYSDAVGVALRVGPSDFAPAHAGDVQDFVYFLRRGVRRGGAR